MLGLAPVGICYIADIMALIMFSAEQQHQSTVLYKRTRSVADQ